MVKNPPSIRALTMGLVSSRLSSWSSEAATIKGMRSRAFCTCGWTVGMVCLLLRESAAPIDYRPAGRSGQAMATQDESLDEAVASPEVRKVHNERTRNRAPAGIAGAIKVFRSSGDGASAQCGPSPGLDRSGATRD